MLRPRGRFSLVPTLLCLSFALAGACAGIFGTYLVFRAEHANLRAEFRKKSERVVILERLLQQEPSLPAEAALDVPLPGGRGRAEDPVLPVAAQTPVEVPASPAPAPAAPAAVAPSVMPASSAAQATAAPEPPDHPVRGRRVRERDKRREHELRASVAPRPPAPRPQEDGVRLVRSEPVPAATVPEVAAQTGVPGRGPTQVVDGPTPTDGEVATATKNARIEGVAAEKVGVVKLHAEGVQLRNGSFVRPGGRFPSGERLLSVEPANARVITDQRQLLLFFPG